MWHNGPVNDLRVLATALIAARIQDRMAKLTPAEDARVATLLGRNFDALGRDFRTTARVWDWARGIDRLRIELGCGHAFYRYPSTLTGSTDPYQAGSEALCRRCVRAADGDHRGCRKVITRVVYVAANRRVDALDHGDNCRACKDGIPIRHHYAPAA